MKSLNILIGLGVYLLVSLFFNGWPFLLYSVICTFGISLVVWLPAFWLIGFICTSIYKLFTSPEMTGNENKATSNFNKNQIVSTNYIQKERAAGVSDQQISLAFKNVGWTDSDIQAAFKYADSIK